MLKRNLKKIITTLCIISGIAAVNANDSKSLSKSLDSFYHGLSQSDKQAQQSAMKALMPTQSDLETLFPGKGQKAWSTLKDKVAMFITDADKIAPQIMRGKVTEIKAINIRSSDSANPKYSYILSSIPKEIPVYRAITKFESGRSAGTSSYVFVNDRWIFIKGLGRIAQKLQ